MQGFDPTWALQPGPVTYSVDLTGSDISFLVGSAPTDGATSRFAEASGSAFGSAASSRAPSSALGRAPIHPRRMIAFERRLVPGILRRR